MPREGGDDTRGGQSQSFADQSSSSSEAKGKEKDSSGLTTILLPTSRAKARDTEPTRQAKDMVGGRTRETDSVGARDTSYASALRKAKEKEEEHQLLSPDLLTKQSLLSALKHPQDNHNMEHLPAASHQELLGRTLI